MTSATRTVRPRPSSTLLGAPGVVATDPALVTASGDVLDHGALRERVEELAARLPDVADGRRLVHLAPRPDVEGVTAYLATIEAGHVALVTADDVRARRILDRYRPDVTATGDADEPFEVTSDAPRHALHPDLALLLSTSGSTGSPKLVRLSHRNLTSNALAIAEALDLTAADRGVTSLPLHYTFGLSVLHSHLAVGGSVVLHDGSVLDDALWRAVDGLGVTTFAVVPHMVELMESSGVLEREHASLRLVAQAGGRMHPDRVLRTAALGDRHGWGLAVMYGQTEATARISVLDPAQVAANPDSVGRPVAGTTVRLDTSVPEATEGSGEVVVRGPGVMMGYAEHPDDLAVGALLDELRTGDLGRLDPDGLLRIVGRRSGFVKVMGLRIDVATVEAALERDGLTACVGADDAGLTVAVEPEAGVPTVETAGRARRLAGEASGVGPAAVAVAVVPLARLDSGKVDRLGCAALVRGGSPDACEETRVRTAEAVGASPTLAVQVARCVGDVLAVDAVDLDRTFVQQGGDSLSHVQASVRLEGLVGPLPRGWHHRPLAELVELGRARRSAPDGTPHGTSHGTMPDGAAPDGATERARPDGDAPARRWRTVETSVLLRAIAVVVICGSHADLFRVLGGAHTLLAVAGFNAARFGLSAPTAGGRWRGVARTLVGIAVPTAVVALVGMLTHDRYGWANVVLANWVLGDVTYGFRNELWFVDALVASTVVLAAVVSVPAVARTWARDPWRVAVVVAAVALVPRFVVLHLGEGVLRGIMPTTFWLFAVGAAVAHADTRRRRLLTLAVAVVGGVTFFPDDPVRNLTILGGIAVLTLVPEVRLPARVVPVLGVVAAASLYVYLVQFQVLGRVPTPLGGTLAAVALGCLVWRLADRPVRRLQDLVPLSSRRPSR
ncbi:AMP-binding protein [Cellulomonas carbonis]|uniref:AMP-dependent synthetase n=1 Tax=Cellulomonas carbonis T26 TaxID=947969 RepID=A0A0A0BMN5_9CELL|nr:AMP-binding protein [Cellulomonas carbonis]KGM09728.1 AMP-dependent synthetase [Cellulomonas carbonis T26]GGB99987.1 AMP-dependent synthetase [Cellulomonas carbonis]